MNQVTLSTTPPSKPTSEQSYLILLEFLLLLKRHVVALGTEHGLSGMQTMTLFLLQTPRPMHAFKTIFNCDASNVTGIVDSLEQKDLVTRFESTADRRLKMVKLRAKGSRLRQELICQLIKSDNPIMTKLTSREYERFVRLVEKIAAPAANEW